MTALHEHLPDASARRRTTGSLDETLFVEAGAGSGKTRSLVDRVVALVADGVEMRHIAAITFTEKAAAELRDRIRTALTTAADEAPDEPTRQRFATSLEQVDAAAISTLHAFAQRVLTENPIEAALPPNVDVLDEVASQVEFTDRWTRFRDELFEDPALERCLLLAFTAGVRPEDLRSLATAFGGNWDLVADPRRIPWADTEPPALDLDPLLQQLDALVARRSECDDDEDLLCRRLTEEIEPYAERLRQAPDEYEALRLLCHDAPTWGGQPGRKANWRDKPSVVEGMRAVGEYLTELANEITDACVHRIAAEIARFTLQAADARRGDGRLEFHDLLVMARQLLRGEHGVGVRRRLRQRYQRLLLDEFQDTDPIQIELACLIASDDPDAGAKPWHQIPVEPGRLFFVGDPKQSIYRFRRADIGLFLSAREAFGNAVELTTNFRATPPLIDWVNHVFGRLITYEKDAQPEYQPIDAAPTRTVPPVGPPVAVMGRTPHPQALTADELRDREATDVADAVLTARGWQVSEKGDDDEYWRGARLGDITILLPARTSLAALERALDARDIPYRAETSSLVYATREIRDLMATVRAVADPTDQLTLVTTLRSPVFGCGDDELFTYKAVHGGRWSLFAEPPETLDDSHPVVAALAYLRQLHDQVSWLAPSELVDRIARDRRLFELGYAFGRPRDLWRRLRFVIDQARAWSEAEGGTVREYLEWARWQASESTRVAETVLPETDDDSVRIMTIHSAKGLEFPIAILSGMTTAARGPTSRVAVTFPADGAAGIKVGRSLVTREFAAHEPIDEQMDHHERLRLLYVAATRAQDHLVVSLHRAERAKPPEKARNYKNAELLADACADLELVELQHAGAQAPADPAGEVTPPESPPESPPDLAEWEAERAATLRASSRRRSLGASDVALLALSPEPNKEPDASDQEARPSQESTVDEEETAAGAAKQPRDLELPPWQKGRYGTAIGRAVHGVLQTVDLATGAGLTETVAAQAAAEGVIGREPDIRRLAQAALDAPVVKESLRWPRWRETYVATQVGDRTLEGYLDLLYRTDDGLVIVDYKTASTTAHLEARMDTYRAQGGAYAVAVEQAVGEPVVRVVFCFLTAEGAVELALPDLEDAKHDVRAAVTAGL